MNLRNTNALRVLVGACLLIGAMCSTAMCQDGRVLKNGKITAQFNADGLASIKDVASGKTVEFSFDDSAITVDDKVFDTGPLSPVSVKEGKDSLTYAFNVDGGELKVVYQLKPGWRFVSKQIVFAKEAGAVYRVNSVEMLRTELLNRIAGEHKISGGNYGATLRFADGDKASWGMLFVVQNPFNRWNYSGRGVGLSYQPDMEWKSEYGAFESDRLCLAPYTMTGVMYAARSIAEWRYVQDPDAAVANAIDKIDKAEIEAYQECVRAFLLFSNKKSIRMDVGWCENDYQIDCGTPEGRAEYKRIIDQSANIGCNYILYGPSNSKVSSLQENRDAWGWENVLWLGMGQKIRKDEWDPKTGKIDPSIREMLDYAKSKKIKLVAYAYPTMGYMQNPEWTKWCNNRPGGYSGVDTGNRSFQDWFVRKLVDFKKRTGIGGYSFDHWWIAYDSNKDSDTKVSSRYAQWYGCRRITCELRRLAPDVVVDGRQQYHYFGPWTWVAGSYPHPFGGDEQPGSFRARADLHTDRLSANHVRYVNWNYRMQSFCPVELTPGYFTHQTQRSDANGDMHHDPWRRADWDYLGWKYSVISSIATAPLNHVANFVPARDTAEFKAFSKADQSWLRGWLDWTDKNKDILRNSQFIIGPCMVGRVDGTAAFDGDRGFVFLFNANYRRMNAEFTLDSSIGLSKGTAVKITQIYPKDGMLIGKPGEGIWRIGDKFTLPMEGASAVVLAVTPAKAITEPVVYNSNGKAVLDGDRLILTDVSGEIGTVSNLMVGLPQGKAVKSVTVNGETVSFTQSGAVVSLDVKFAGKRFSQCQQVGEYDPKFNDSVFKSEFSIPARVFAQLKARKKAWPVEYTADDMIAPWIGVDRLLLFVNIADAKAKSEVTVKINGKPVEVKKAFNGIYPNSGDQTFIGFYVDVANLNPDTNYQVEVGLPAGLEPGQFQGLYFDNVETEYTGVVGKG